MYIDDPVWLEFKQRVMRKSGSLRKLSAEVEGLIRGANVETEVVCGFEKLGVKAKGNISSQEIKANRPRALQTKDAEAKQAALESAKLQMLN